MKILIGSILTVVALLGFSSRPAVRAVPVTQPATVAHVAARGVAQEDCREQCNDDYERCVSSCDNFCSGDDWDPDKCKECLEGCRADRANCLRQCDDPPECAGRSATEPKR
jgi:hypothetical protein